MGAVHCRTLVQKGWVLMWNLFDLCQPPGSIAEIPKTDVTGAYKGTIFHHLRFHIFRFITRSATDFQHCFCIAGKVRAKPIVKLPAEFL